MFIMNMDALPTKENNINVRKISMKRDFANQYQTLTALTENRDH